MGWGCGQRARGAPGAQSAACAVDQASSPGLGWGGSHDWNGDCCLPRHPTFPSFCGRNQNAGLQVPYPVRHCTHMVYRGTTQTTTFQFFRVSMYVYLPSLFLLHVLVIFNNFLWGDCAASEGLLEFNLFLVGSCIQIVAVLIPFLFFLAYYIRRRSIRDFHNSFLGEYPRNFIHEKTTLLLSLLLSTEILKRSRILGFRMSNLIDNIVKIIIEMGSNFISLKSVKNITCVGEENKIKYQKKVPIWPQICEKKHEAQFLWFFGG